MNKRSTALIAMIVVAALARLLPHPPNVTPVAAIALFGGAYLRNLRLAFVVPIAAMLLSDVILGYTTYGAALFASQPVVYACMLATVAIGIVLRRSKSPLRIGVASLASSCLFFVVTNLSVWAFGSRYAKTWDGLMSCYVAAVPFFRNSVAGDLLFVILLFGGFALLEHSSAAVREERAPAVA